MQGTPLAARKYTAGARAQLGQITHGAAEADPRQETQSFHNGHWFYFCGLDCRTKFLATPAAYLEQ